MATRYVGPSSAGAADGTSWADRYGSLTDAEDTPVVAGDEIFVGPGVYRETLTVDVSGGAGNIITYIGDVTGEHTDQVGGIVRITGSDNDQTGARNNCIVISDKDYRTFRGFMMDTVAVGGTSNLVRSTNGSHHLVFEDCSFQSGVTGASALIFTDADQSDIILRRCLFWVGHCGNAAIEFYNAADVEDAGHIIQNCIIIGAKDGVVVVNVGGITIRNCLICNQSDDGVDCTEALAVGQTIDVENCIFYGIANNAVEASDLGDLVEDYNTFWGCVTDRSNVDVGANSETCPPLFVPPILHAGASQASGFKFPWWFGELSEWSAIAAITGSNQPLVDLHGIERPHPDNRKSWGPIQFAGVERSTAQVHGGNASELHYRPSRKQFFVPSTNVSTTVSAWVYREANYRADRNPGFVLKQPGAADRTTRDAGAVAQWNQISDTFTPNATPPWFMIELVNDNYYSTTTSTSTTSTSTTRTDTSTSTSTTTTSTSTTTTTLNVWFDDIAVS